jgi:hypothetical protein
MPALDSTAAVTVATINSLNPPRTLLRATRDRNTIATRQ